MLGKVRAKQYYSDDHARERNLGILLHGDGSFSGQARRARHPGSALPAQPRAVARSGKLRSARRRARKRPRRRRRRG